MAQTQAKSAAAIVAALDFDRPSIYALRRAAEIFRRSPASELDVLHVNGSLSESEDDRATIARTAGRVHEFVRRHLGDPSSIAGRLVGIHVRVGEVASEIVRFSLEVDAQLLVVGSHGRNGIARRLLGSKSEEVLALSNIPVVIATGDPSKEPPAIEPPCRLCQSVRHDTDGKRWWCSRHATHHTRARSYSYRQEWPYEVHDSDVIPTGVDLV